MCIILFSHTQSKLFYRQRLDRSIPPFSLESAALTSIRKSISLHQLSCLHKNTSNACQVLWLPIPNCKLQNTNLGVNQSKNQCAALILTGGHWISISLSAFSLVQFPVPKLPVLFNIYVYTMKFIFFL